MNKTTVKSLLALTAAIALAGGAKAESYTSSQNFASSVEVTGSTVTGGATADSAVVFTAADSSTGLTVTEDNMTLGSGYWTIESGKYRFCNDLFINGGNLTINGDSVETKFWLVMNGTSSFTITNGTFTTAVNNGASNPNNGAMDLGRDANSDITVNITGGTVTSHGSANSGDKWLALMLANGANTKGTMTISNSGAYTSPNDISIGRGSAAAGALVVKDSGTFSAWTMYLAQGANSIGSISLQNSAAMSLTGTLQGAVSSSGTSEIDIEGGTLSVNGDLYVAVDGTGTMTIGGGEDVAKVTLPNTVWASITRGSGKGTITLKTNGTFETPFVQANDSSASDNTFIFDGGTLRKTRSDVNNGGYIIGTEGNVTVEVTENGGTLDLQTFDATCAATFSGTGTLVKKGSGLLTLTGSLAGFTGKLLVEEGSIAVSPSDDFGGTIEFAAENTAGTLTLGGTFGFDSLSASGTTVTATKTIPVSADYASRTTFNAICEGIASGATPQFSYDSTLGAFVVSYTHVCHVWNGEADAVWTDTANWTMSDGTEVDHYPQSVADIVVFNTAGARVSYGNNTIKPVHAIFVNEDTSIFTPQGWPTLRAYTVSGEGTLTMETGIGLQNIDGADMEVSCDVTIVKNTLGNDVWLKSANGLLTFKNNTITVSSESSPAIILDEKVAFENCTIVNNSSQTLRNSSSITFSGCTFSGTGSYYIDSNCAFTGPLTVDGIYLTLPFGTEIGGNLDLSAGWIILDDATLTKDGDAATALTVNGTVTGLENVVIKTDDAAIAWKVASSEAEGVTTVTAQTLTRSSENPVVTHWIGGTSGKMATASNWTAGCPSADFDSIAYINKAITLQANDKDGGMYGASNLVINADVTWVSPNQGSAWPSLCPIELNGTGTLTLKGCGLRTPSGISSTINVPINVVHIDGEKDQDSWIQNLDGSTITFNKKITSTTGRLILYSGSTVINADVEMQSSYYNAIQDGVTINGTVTVAEDSILYNDNDATVDYPIVVNGTYKSAKADVVISGNLSGSGAIEHTSGAITLSGNNSGFSGTFTKTHKNAVQFASVDSGSAQAKWVLAGDIRTTFESGTFSLGTLDWRSAADYGSDNWHVWYTDNATGMVTMEVGARNEDNRIGSSSYTCLGQNTTSTLRKVGTGNIDLWFNTYHTLDIAGGTATIQNNNGPSQCYKFTGTDSSNYGTLVMAYVYSWDPTGRFKDSTAPVSIDTCGNDFTWAGFAASNTGGLVKKGEGVLTLTGTQAYTGDTSVLGGKLILPLNTSVGTVTVAEGAELDVNGSSLEVTENTPYAILSGSADSDSLARINVLGSDWNWSASSADGTISATATAWGDVPNVWVGGESGNWKDAVNWSRNIVPQEAHAVKFESSARVYLDGNKTFDSMDVAEGAKVAFQSSNISNTHPTMRPKTMTGSGTVALHHAGIIPNGVAMTIPATLTIEIEKVNAENTSDSWLEGDAASAALTIDAPITGQGYLIFRDWVILAGDNSGFQGKVLKESNGTITFTSASAGSAAASWEFQSDVYTTALTEGTLKFGALTLTGQKLWFNNSSSALVVEVGALGTDTECGGNFFFGTEKYNSGTNPENFTLKKVGSGKLTYASYGIRKIEVAEGELALVQPTHGDGAWASYRDNHAGYQIDSLVVREGAALSGSCGDEPIHALDFEAGGILKSTLASSSETVDDVTTYSYSVVSPLAVSGTASVAGMKVQITNPEVINDVMEGDNEAAKTALLESKLSVLTATSITGNALLASTMTAEDRKIWRVKNTGASLDLCEGKLGFLILFR